MWRVMGFVFEALRAALRFVPLREIPQQLRGLLHHLARPNGSRRPKAIERFFGALRPKPG
jgi:hypothetical protein